MSSDGDGLSSGAAAGLAIGLFVAGAALFALYAKFGLGGLGKSLRFGGRASTLRSGPSSAHAHEALPQQEMAAVIPSGAVARQVGKINAKAAASTDSMI